MVAAVCEDLEDNNKREKKPSTSTALMDCYKSIEWCWLTYYTLRRKEAGLKTTMVDW